MPQGEQHQMRLRLCCLSAAVCFSAFALPFIQIDPTITKAEKTSYEII